MNKIMTAVAAAPLVSATAMAAPSAYARAGGGHMGNIGPTGGAHFEADDHFENYRLGEANTGQWHGRRFYPASPCIAGLRAGLCRRLWPAAA